MAENDSTGSERNSMTDNRQPENSSRQNAASEQCPEEMCPEEICAEELCTATPCPDCGCGENETMSGMLRAAGMRPTRQRIALGELLFAAGDRHVCAEMLHEEAVAARIPVSLATVYNTLNQFRDAGLLREVALVGTRVFFDTNMSDHQHFFVEGSGEVLDIPGGAISLSGLPEAPEGMEIAGVDVVVRLRPKS